MDTDALHPDADKDALTEREALAQSLPLQCPGADPRIFVHAFGSFEELESGQAKMDELCAGLWIGHPPPGLERTRNTRDASNSGILANTGGGSDMMICNLRTHRYLGALVISLMIAFPTDDLAAGEIAFSDWTHQRFSLLGGNTWRQQGSELSVESDGAVSLLWQAVSEESRMAQTASWTWSVEQGVPPTELTQRGGDDRNLSVYVIFAPAESVAAAERQGIRSLLDNPDVRVLMYVWGGAHARGDLLSSPYLDARGKTIVLRPAEVGQHDERVDLRADLERAFGVNDLALVGLAVSADSDDTGTAIRARIRMLRLS